MTVNWDPKLLTWSQNQLFAEHLLSLVSHEILYMGKHVIIYSVGHSKYRWDKIYSRLSHVLLRSTTRFCAKVSLCKNSHRRCYWTPTAFIKCPLCAKLHNQCWEHGQYKIDTDPHLLELMSFPRHVSHEEVTPIPYLFQMRPQQTHYQPCHTCLL